MTAKDDFLNTVSSSAEKKLKSLRISVNMRRQNRFEQRSCSIRKSMQDNSIDYDIQVSNRNQEVSFDWFDWIDVAIKKKQWITRDWKSAINAWIGAWLVGFVWLSPSASLFVIFFVSLLLKTRYLMLCVYSKLNSLLDRLWMDRKIHSIPNTYSIGAGR